MPIFFILKEKAVTWDGRNERRKTGAPLEQDCRGGLWSTPDGHRLPNMVDSLLVLGDPGHPARLKASDLDDPEGFRTRLNAWLMRQR